MTRVERKNPKLPNPDRCTKHLQSVPDTTKFETEATSVRWEKYTRKERTTKVSIKHYCQSWRCQAPADVVRSRCRQSVFVVVDTSRARARQVTAISKKLFLFLDITSVLNDYKQKNHNLRCATLGGPALPIISDRSGVSLLRSVRDRLSSGRSFLPENSLYSTRQPANNSQARQG